MEAVVNMHIDDCSYFTEENLLETNLSSIFLGKYQLIVKKYKTRPKCWEYTWGIIKDGDKTIVSIQSNYHVFIMSELRHDEYDYIVVSPHYETPAIINLTSRTSRFVVSDKFCFANCELSPSGNTLLVCGCYWACPYEYKLYDFETGVKLTMSCGYIDSYGDITNEKSEDEPHGWPSIYEPVKNEINWTDNDSFCWKYFMMYFVDLDKWYYDVVKASTVDVSYLSRESREYRLLEIREYQRKNNEIIMSISKKYNEPQYNQ